MDDETRIEGGPARQAIFRALREHERENGRLDPREVIESARSPQHPLHDYFEWNDARAADKYRLQQARALIRSFRMVELPTETVRLRVPAYLATASETPEYQRAPAVRSEAERAAETLGAEVRRMAGIARRAASVADYLGQGPALARILSDIETLETELTRETA